MEANGNVVDHEYKIERGGDKVAEVSKRWFRIRDTYGIEIAPGEKDALILALTVCIDQMTRVCDAERAAASSRHEAALDSPPATPSRCDGRGHYCGPCYRRGAGRDGLGHDRGFRDRMADDTDSSDACCSQRHFILLRLRMLHRPRWRR
jgi:hypothetical protein